MTLLTKPSLLDLRKDTSISDKKGVWLAVERGQTNEIEWPHPIDEQFTSVGVDVTLGVKRKPFDLTARKFLDFTSCGRGASRQVTIPANHTVSVETNETISLSYGLAALVKSKVRLVSQGFTHISTTIDPGWSAPILITFTNLTAYPIPLSAGTRIATLVFFQTSVELSDGGDATSTNLQDRWNGYHNQDSQRRFWHIPAAILATSIVPLIIAYLVYKYYPNILNLILNSFKNKEIFQMIVWALSASASTFSIFRGYRTISRWLNKRFPGSVKRHIL